MKRRCYNKNAVEHRLYGGRGITVCEEWKNSYLEFRKWALANGYDENAPFGKTTLDRIDVNGNYCPENCRIVDMYVQSMNRRCTARLTLDGVTKTAKEWSIIKGINYGTIIWRMNHGFSDEKTLTAPLRKKRR